jgi:hypothetical protein
VDRETKRSTGNIRVDKHYKIALTLHVLAAEYKFFSSVHGIFLRIKIMLNNKKSSQ